MFNPKNFPLYLSLLTLVFALGFIRYTNNKLNLALGKIEHASKLEEGSLAPANLDENSMQPIPAITFDLPDKLNFAGEEVPLHLTDVHERVDKELHINTYWHNNTIFLMKRANRWLPQIQEILRKHNIPDDFKYLPLIESGLMNDVSPKEAVGFWQILKSAGKENGLEITDEVDERYDPLKATEAACRYLKTSYKKFGNWTVVAASYNRGMGGMERALENQKVDSYYDLFLNDETSRYVFRIIACKEIIENPSRYGFKINPRHLYQPEQLRYVEVHESIKDLVDFAKKHGTNYKLLKRHNPWLRDDKLTVKKGKVYKIAFPV
jgi:membrane-bound lytic murein transglycosylase D